MGRVNRRPNPPAVLSGQNSRRAITQILLRLQKSSRLLTETNYPLRLEALRGLIFALVSAAPLATCVARLQLPTFHFNSGSGHAVQYQPDDSSTVRLQPSHCSTTWRQLPPVYEQPCAVINEHSLPSLTVLHIIENTSFKVKNTYIIKDKNTAFKVTQTNLAF